MNYTHTENATASSTHWDIISMDTGPGWLMTNGSGHHNHRHRAKIISDHSRFLFEVIVHCSLCTMVSVVGISTNVINIIVFVRQGVMTESSNTSLMGLAVADVCSLVTMLWHSVCYAVMLADPPDISWDPLSVLYVTGGYPHVMFTRVTCWITAFVALERCLCVTLPFKVKMIFTPKRSLCIVIIIFTAIILSYSPIFYCHQLKWLQMANSSTTKLVLVFTDDRDQIENISHYVNDVILPTACLLLVLVCTRTIVSKINSSKEFRKAMSAQPQQIGVKLESKHPDPNSASQQKPSDKASLSPEVSRTAHAPSQTSKTSASFQKDRKVARMVTLICIIFLVCNTPCILIIYLRFVVTEISSTGRYHNFFMAIYSLDFLLETINSSVNIVVYYTMSSRYKREFDRLFGIGSKE